MVLALGAIFGLHGGVPFLETRHRGLALARALTVAFYALLALGTIALRPGESTVPSRSFTIALAAGLLLGYLTAGPVLWGVIACKAIVISQLPRADPVLSLIFWELGAADDMLANTFSVAITLASGVLYATFGQGRARP
ncbi:hypothetical protein GCM10010201_33990 [Pilimelia columellifera subsp. columellifera]|uniref:Uncharacterized protein n=1 Tax=Pilimelia columellifera subsp. columellifera TaxID=706583 RepID=A0ABN3NQZ7_9ACTN